MPDVQVAQAVNLIPLLQTHLAAVGNAKHPHHAALPIAHMYHLLHSLGELDADFQRRWKDILDGEFTEWAACRRWRLDLEWEDIWAAKTALLRLMDRRGMLFKITGRDPLDARHDDFTTDLRRERQG